MTGHSSKASIQALSVCYCCPLVEIKSSSDGVCFGELKTSSSSFIITQGESNSTRCWKWRNIGRGVWNVYILFAVGNHIDNLLPPNRVSGYARNRFVYKLFFYKTHNFIISLSSSISSSVLHQTDPIDRPTSKRCSYKSAIHVVIYGLRGIHHVYWLQFVYTIRHLSTTLNGDEDENKLPLMVIRRRWLPRTAKGRRL